MRFRQEVFVSPNGNATLDEIVAKYRESRFDDDTNADDVLADLLSPHAMAGFEKGSGGRAKFRRLLRDGTGNAEPLPAFQYIDEVDVIEGLSAPMAQPTTVPSRPPIRIPTGAPLETSKAPTMEIPIAAWSSPRPTTAPTRGPMWGSEVPSLTEEAPVDGTKTPQNDTPRTDAPWVKPMKMRPTISALTQIPSRQPSVGKNSCMQITFRFRQKARVRRTTVFVASAETICFFCFLTKQSIMNLR